MRRSSVLLWTVLACVGASGCASLFGGGSGRSTSAAHAGGSSWTFVNETSTSLCQVWMQGNRMDSNAFANGELAPGASVSLDLAADRVDYVYATDCSGERTLAGFPDSTMNPARRPLGITQHTIALVPAGASPSDASAYALAVDERSVSDWIDGALALRWGEPNPTVGYDEDLAGDGLNFARNMVRQNGWSETLSFAFLSTDGWLMHEQLRIGWLGAYMGIGGRGFEAFVGGHWPSGVCALQDYGFTQSGDGYSFDGPVRTAVGMHVPVPCAILDRVPAARSGVAR